ncbi:Maf family protein [Streptococcus ovuberis]|uniref:dTTP/UTP pyrophosphatase n=1 Tax=Streptococcus ovuberis TaxID=1936207 RepID=A0A7X6MYY9_9STRE|nr:septum formation protein Maf [Streptococcus ovuberis]
MIGVFEYESSGKRKEVKSFVLLSASPRRQELLRFLDPEVRAIAIDERKIEETFMAHYAKDEFLVRAAKTCCEISKAKSSGPLEEGKLYISADTMVILGEEVYNKPRDLEDAKRMLRSYFGRSQHVVTSVCLRMEDYLEVFYSVAQIDFVAYYPALEEAIEAYVEEKRPLDKSGAYGIQELDPRFVKQVLGDIYTIIGLPVAEIASRLFGK